MANACSTARWQRLSRASAGGDLYLEPRFNGSCHFNLRKSSPRPVLDCRQLGNYHHWFRLAASPLGETLVVRPRDRFFCWAWSL